MIKVIITDIEGTTSSISFVHKVLFPYAKAHIAEYVRANAGNNDVRTLLDDVAKEAAADPDDIDGLIRQLLLWIEQDKKITPLKALQGLIWEHGYNQGDFTGHVYEDAADSLKQWKESGFDLYVYSSGSVKAQQLIFGHTEFGDLTPLFKGYFDTRIGGKREADSYKNIVQQIGVDASELLFLSDIEEELDAASEAGIQTCWLIRVGDSTIPLDMASKKHFAVSSFADITPILSQSSGS